MQPRFLSSTELEELRSQHPDLALHDKLELAVDELFDIAYPAKKDNKTTEEVAAYQQSLAKEGLEGWGQWVYYPWLNQVVHFPPQKELRMLRTSRNRNLVTAEEQTELYGATIVVIGMSVGSNVVEALASQGIGQKLVLVDMDIIEPSNLNRIRSPYHHVGLHKVDAISRKVWEIDPYIEIVAYRDGLDETSLADIVASHSVDILIDEMDELSMKIKLREAAKSKRIPVIMAADDGDNALIDIERYDLDPELEIFGGRIPADIIDKIKSQKLPRAELGMMIGRYFVGPENIPLRMYESLGEVGKSLPSWPQLGGAAALSGVALAYTAKKIILNQPINTGRVLISLDEKLSQDHLDEAHQAKLQQFQKMMKG